MFSDVEAYLVNKECLKDRGRELEHQWLIQTAELQQSVIRGWPGKVANWVGIQLVKWGSKLQGYDPVSLPNVVSMRITDPKHSQN